MDRQGEHRRLDVLHALANATTARKILVWLDVFIVSSDIRWPSIASIPASAGHRSAHVTTTVPVI
jgi:hypothetical protein